MNTLINATVVSNFAAAGRLDILQNIYVTLNMAYTVFEELQKGAEERYDFLVGLEASIYPFHVNGWLRLVTLEGEAEVALYDNAPLTLHRGEAMSLAIAANRNWQFLTDDRAARAYAVQLGVPISGTLGVLAVGVKQELISVDEANKILELMIARARYRSPVTDLRMLLPKENDK